MSWSFSKPLTMAGVAGVASWQLATADNAVSPEAKAIGHQRACISRQLNLSLALLDTRYDALARLGNLAAGHLAEEGCALHPIIVANAEWFLRAMPNGVAMPDFAVEPDGCISLDWMPSRLRWFSVSIGMSKRLACAWLDGSKSGHFVEVFEGEIPRRVLHELNELFATPAHVTLRAA